MTDNKERERERKGKEERYLKRRTKKQFARKSLLPARAAIVRA